ncbi:MAG: lysylphosphatidylglycerol synthase transmembrane domain-containing protein [Sphingomonadaceae bacterium]
MKKRYWFGIAVSALLVYLMARSVELASVARAFAEADYAFVLPAVALYFAGVVVRTTRWWVLLGPVRRPSLRRLFVVQVMGFMANDILPLRAGEAVRAYVLWRKERLDPSTTVATIVVERILDGLVLTGFLIVAGLLMPLESWLTQLAWVASAAFVAAVAVVVALGVVPGPVVALVSLLVSPLPRRVGELGVGMARRFVEGLGVVKRGSDAAAVVGLSVVAWLLEAGMYYVLMFSFPFQPQLLASVLGAAAANLGTMVPSSPGYVGTFDVPLSAVLVGTFHVDLSTAAGYTLLVHATLILPVTLLGLLFAWREGLSLRRIATERVTASGDEGDPPDGPEVAPRRSTP